MKKRRSNPEVKIDAVNEYLKGNVSQETIARRLGVDPATVRQWIANYNSMGLEAFRRNGKIHMESPGKGYRRIRDDLERYHDIKANDKWVHQAGCQSSVYR